ncbi:MAG: DUF6265 family protein [Acidobacteriota bacterium]|nr:DUF6265 family protein [Acidobacteriota bacterium]
MLMTLFTALAVSLAPQAAPARHTINDVAWIAGCWTSSSGGRQVDEQWMKPAGGTMLGISRTVAKGRTVATEFIQLREEADGLYYIALPSGQSEARFKLVAASEGSARFENPAHDFPQVITYVRQPDGSLVAQISGTVNGKARAIDYPMQRGSCGA